MPDSPVKPFATSINQRIERLLSDGGIGVLATIIEAPEAVGAKLLIEESGKQTGGLSDPDLDRAVASHVAQFLKSHETTRVFQVKEFASELDAWKEARVLFERIQPEPRIVICGAGHVGAALANLASMIGYQVTLIDDRAEFVLPERFPSERIALVAAETWTEAVKRAIGNGRGVSVAVVTRGHNEDAECMHAVIQTNADYIGLIGSKRRTNIVLDRLRERGANNEKLKKVHAPIGLDIGAVSPEEVALSILAEIVAERRGGEGGSLSAWRRKE
jgi:xanthine dehydrogenase accessory factor